MDVLMVSTTVETVQLMLLEALQGQGSQVRQVVRDLVKSHHTLDQKYRRALWQTHGCAVTHLREEAGLLFCDNIARHRILCFSELPIYALEEEVGKAFLTDQGIILPGLNDGRHPE